MFTKVLSEDSKGALALLGKGKILEETYLAGGINMPFFLLPINFWKLTLQILKIFPL